MAKRKCTFIVKGKPCSQPGTGNPPLCDEHAPDEEFEYDDDFDGTGDFVGDAIYEFSENPRIRGVLDKAASVFDKLAQVIDRASTRQNARPQSPPGSPPPPPRQKRPVSQETITPSAARTILGFAQTQPLTVESVKERKRALASMFHPDKGGSVEAMQRVNAAADVLFDALKR